MNIHGVESRCGDQQITDGQSETLTSQDWDMGLVNRVFPVAFGVE